MLAYEVDGGALAVYVAFVETAAHSNVNFMRLKELNVLPRYRGIGRALLAYAVAVSMDAGYGGVVVLRAKTTELREYYIKEYGARPGAAYDPFRLIIWEEQASDLIGKYIMPD